MAPGISPPIIVDESGDISFFASVEEACSGVESYDVLNGEYEVFDAHGRPLALTVVGYQVELAEVPDEEPRPGELAERLRGFVAAVGPERIGLRDSGTATLGVMVEALTQFFGLSERRD